MGKERKLTPRGGGISEEQQEKRRKKIYQKPVLVTYPSLIIGSGMGDFYEISGVVAG